MNALTEPLRIVTSTAPAALALPMQELMAKILGEARMRPLRQVMLVGAGPKVGTSLVARQAAEQLAAAYGHVLVLQVAEDLPDEFSTAVPAELAVGGPVTVLRMPTSICLRLFSTAARTLPNVHTLQAGATSGQRCASLPAEWLETFGLILWDVPPPTVAPLALVMASNVDGVVLLAQAYRTRRQVAMHVVQRLQDSGGHIMGVVLNRTHNFIPDWIYRLL